MLQQQPLFITQQTRAPNAIFVLITAIWKKDNMAYVVIDSVENISYTLLYTDALAHYT